MRLPEIALLACLTLSPAPEALSAEPMGATSRASVQIVASVAPRFQVTEPDDPTALEGGQGGLCIQANTPMESYSLISVDSSGEEHSVVGVSSSALCHGMSGFDGTALSLASDATSTSTPVTLLITPE